MDCATYFDIRFKNTFVADSDAVKERLLNDIDSVTVVKSDTDTTEQARSDEQASEGPTCKLRKTGSGLTRLLSDIIHGKKQELDAHFDPTSSTPAVSPSAMLQNEFLLHGQVNESKVGDDPLAWWRTNAACFPHLAKLARKYRTWQLRVLCYV